MDGVRAVSSVVVRLPISLHVVVPPDNTIRRASPVPMSTWTSLEMHDGHDEQHHDDGKA